MADFINKLKNEEGSGLILALMTLMVLAVLGASLGTITIGSHRLSSVNRDSTSAYYIAEAGANQAFEEIKGYVYDAHESTSGQSSFFNRVDELANPYFGGQSINDFSSQFGDSPESVVTLSRNDKKGETVSYELQSVGKVEGRERKVIKAFDVTHVSESIEDIEFVAPENAAIVSNGKVTLNNHSEIHGDVWVNDRGQVDDSRNGIKKEIRTPIKDWDLYNELLKIDHILNKDFQELSTSDIVTDENEVKYYRIDDLDTSKYNIGGEGIVHLLVTNSINFNGNSFGNEIDSNKVRIYYTGNNDITMPNHYTLNASLYIHGAKFTLRNHSTFNGVIIHNGNEMEVNNHAEISAYIIAPNATVNFNNWSTLKGSLVAQEVDMGNHAKIYYQNVGSYPFTFRGSGEASDVDIEDIIISTPIIEPK